MELPMSILQALTGCCRAKASAMMDGLGSGSFAWEK